MKVLIVIVILAVATSGTYYRVIGSEFLDYDDRDYVTGNIHVMGGLTAQGVIWAFTHFHSCNWHPVTWMSHMADVSLFGMQPSGHHFVNLCLHILNAILLFLFLKYVTQRIWASAFVAALFALHPLHVESVAWVAERKDVLSTFFWLATLVAYAWYARRPGLGRYASVTGLFALGLMSKPMVVTLPIVLLLLDYWPLGRISLDGWHLRAATGSPARLVLEKVPLGILSLGSAAVTLVAQRQAMHPQELLDTASRVANAVVSYGRYIWAMVWPRGLAAFYPYPSNSLYAEAAIILLFVAGVTAAVMAAGRKHRYLPAGWLWYIVTLVPVLGFVQVGRQSHADRYTYIPLIGLFIMVAWGAAEMADRWRRLRKPMAVAAIAVLVVLGVLTWMTTAYWRDDGALFSRAVRVTKNNYRMMSNLGIHLMRAGDYSGSMALLQESLALKGDDPYTLNAAGTIMLGQGRYDEAERYYKTALQAKPDFDEANFNMGIVFWQTGRPKEAAEYFQKTVEAAPEWAEAWNSLGQALSGLGQYDKGREAFERALSLKPGLAEAYFGLGGVYARTGDLGSAVEALQKSAAISPSFRTLNNLGACLVAMGRPGEAEKPLRDAIKIEPNDASGHMDLAAALAALGRRDEAISELETAMRLEPDNADIRAYYQAVKGAGQ